MATALPAHDSAWPKTATFVVDPEFRAAMPALAAEERQALRESLQEDGCRDPLVVWDSPSGPILIDGHNRLQLCGELGIPYSVVRVQLDDREAAKDWIDRTQLGRRNLSVAQKALLRGRLYNRTKAGHGGARQRASAQHENLRTAERIAREFGTSRATVTRDGRFAEALEVLKELDPDLERRILQGLASPRRQTLIEAAVLAVHDPAAGWRRLQGTMTSTSMEWASPTVVINATLGLFGTIDLDPCSPLDGPTVPARQHYTKEDDGLAHPWRGKVFVNPPYGRVISEWVEKLCSEYEAGRVKEAVFLGPARTDAGWMHRLRTFPRCFPRGRLCFSGEGTAPFASVVVYLGPRLQAFADGFESLGPVYVLLNRPGSTGDLVS